MAREYANLLLRVKGLTPEQADKVQERLAEYARLFPSASLSRTDLEDHGSHSTFVRRKKVV